MSMWMMRRVSGGTEQLRCHEIMELFQSLAQGHAARITVVTPNPRLSRVLTSEFDSFQIARGLTAWEAPDILPFGAFVERLWQDALYSELGDKLPLLLTPAQELLAYAFDILPPQTREFFQACRKHGIEVTEVKPETTKASSVRTSFPSGKEELECAAKWARARLEEGRARIGVVVPQLAQRRREVVRVFSRVMRPGYALPGAEKTPLPFNVSLGEPLANYPLVDAALTLLEFSFHPIDFPRASRLIRS